jgi:hypothetical protein
MSELEVHVPLTAAELLLLRQRLSDGPGTPAVNSALDEKLYNAQVRLRQPADEAEKIREAMAEAKEHPGRTVTVKP